MSADWSEPQDVSDLTIAFPARVVGVLMPDIKDIPREFASWSNTWQQFQSDWFFNGLGAETEIYPKEGVDPKVALRHLKAIQGSYEPKHEHKSAAVAYLASLWFEKVVTPTKTYGCAR